MKIEVTKEDIAQGAINRENGFPRSLSCPVAVAIQRATGNDAVGVGWSQCFVGKVNYAIPEEVSDKIVAFDDDKQVEPFSFELTEILG